MTLFNCCIYLNMELHFISMIIFFFQFVISLAMSLVQKGKLTTLKIHM